MENFKVAEFMLEQRGVDRGSIVTGSSVHNCHVERSCGELCFLARTFSCLEYNELLDPPNELHLFALHYTFISRINEHLQEFKSQWENLHFLLKEIFLLFNYIQMECLKMNTLDMLQLQVCLMLLIGMIMDLTPLPLSLWKKKTTRK